MKESWSETLWNEEIRRCGVVDIAEKDERSKVGMLWTRKKKR
jgi:hypothetical protein